MDYSFIIVASIAIFLGFFVQTIAGFSSGLIAIPILLFFLDLKEAVVIVAIFLFYFSLITIPKCWNSIDKATAKELIIGMFAGLILGLYLLKYGNPILLKKLLGLFTIGYVIYSYYKKTKINIKGRWGVLFGFLGGVFSGLYNSGSPAIIPYIASKVKKSTMIRGTIIGTLGIGNIVRIPLIVYNETLTIQIFLRTFSLIPAFILSLYLGHKLHQKINDNAFKKIVLVLLAITGILLLVR